MANIRIASRYAKSILDLAKEQGKLDTVFNDMKTLQKAVAHKDLASLLRSPIISADKKNKVLDAVFSGKIDELTKAYLHLLTEKGRESNLAEITHSFIHQYNVINGVTRVKIISAAPLNEVVLDEIKKSLLASTSTAQKLEIETKVDSSLIGGFIVEYEDKRYDSSVLRKLNDMKAQFKDNLFVKSI